MSGREVPGYLFRQMVDEAERELTLDRYIAGHSGEIERETARIQKPIADPWRLWDNRIREFEYKRACEDIVTTLWQLHRKAFREQWDQRVEAHIAQHGDYRMMQAGGPTYDMVCWMLKRQEQGKCECARLRRQKEMEDAVRIIRRYMAPKGYLEAHVLEEVA